MYVHKICTMIFQVINRDSAKAIHACFNLALQKYKIFIKYANYLWNHLDCQTKIFIFVFINTNIHCFMRKIILSFIVALSCCLYGFAGSLDSWEVLNFKGVWEIKPSNPDYNLSWLLEGLVSDLGNSPIFKAELALDSNGWGYLSYESDEMAGIINICGTIFIPHPNSDCDEVLSLLCRQTAETPVSGIRSIRVVNPNNGPARPDERGLAIRSMNLDHYASIIQITNEYSPASVFDVNCSSMQIQYHSNGISVVDADGSPVSVYGIDGTLYYQTQSYKGETIRLNKDTCYIIRAGDNSMKLKF